MSKDKSIISTLKNKLTKLIHWEHWSVYTFYLPLIPYAFYEAFKSRNLCFFYSTNPGIYHSGSGVESKYKTLQLVPEKFRPKSALIPQHSKWEDVLRIIEEAEINFPMIAKPDIGYRGYLVKSLTNSVQLSTYISKFNEIDIILQDYIIYQKECGIFYTKKPSDDKGTITSITLKKFLTVKGNGQSTLRELILNDERASLYFEQFENYQLHNLDLIVKKGEEFQLSIVGNHSKGTQFIDGNHLIDLQLNETFDKICYSINGFNYGRLDIKYNNFEDLKMGLNFKILEVNGIISEPTHVFDTSSEDSSYWNTLKEQVKHWAMLSDIARENHALLNVPYHPFSAFIKDLFWIKKHSKKLKKLNKIQF